MTEAAWMASDNLTPMLKFLRGMASERKLRLFAVACCRRRWGGNYSRQFREAIEAGEQNADGPVGDGVIEAMSRGIVSDRDDWHGNDEIQRAARLVTLPRSGVRQLFENSQLNWLGETSDLEGM